MAVPRNRHSSARKNSRRAHHALKPKQAGSCPNCSARCMPHRACPSCGVYRERAVVAAAAEETE